MKAVIYARYSTDGQREESIDGFCQGSNSNKLILLNCYCHFQEISDTLSIISNKGADIAFHHTPSEFCSKLYC